MLTKHLLGIDVLEAARERIQWVFDTYPRIIISFSGGKDSTVMLHLVMEEAIKRKRTVGVMFIDWEAQYQLTIQHIQACFDLYQGYIEPYWITLPFLTTNACSQFEPEWICWEKGKESLWVRPLPPHTISDYSYFPFYTYAMTFEEFLDEFGYWFGQGQLTASFVGIRSGESLNRWRTIAGHGVKWHEDGVVRNYTNYHGRTLWNCYPIYDWLPEDIWTYQGKHPEKPYNHLYDLMYKAGLSIHAMRVCEPYGDQQRRGLWLFHVIEPETWPKIVARVAGANMGRIYANESGNVMGNQAITKPSQCPTWRAFAQMLLESMPPATADHYKNKIAVWLRWYSQNEGYTIDTIPDELEGDLGSKDMPSWRRVCKVLLKNDYWCSLLDFSPTKSKSYEKYRKIMKKRRAMWGFEL